MGRKKKSFAESLGLNNATWSQYYNRLVELAISMFEWKNVPETIDPRFLELTLFCDGNAIFFEDEVMGFLALQCANNAPFDVYRVPINRRAYAVNGYQKQLNQEDSIIIYNNMLRAPSRLDAEMFAKRLYNIDRTIDVNVNAQKTPILITCEETQRLTMLNAYKEYQGNEPIIFGDKALNVNGFNVLKTDAPYVSDNLYQLKTQIWNEALTYLGITNVNITKKERLITDEVTRNQGGTIASRYSRLESRKKACKEINKMFGLNIDCDYREDFQVILDEEEVKGGANGE